MIFLISVSTAWRGKTQQRSCWICRHFAPDNIYPVGYDAQHHITGQGVPPWLPSTGHFGPLILASWRAKICESLPAACPAFSVGHFDPLILLRSESGCHLGSLIFNRPWGVTEKRCAHFDHLVFRNRSINFRSLIREELGFIWQMRYA